MCNFSSSYLLELQPSVGFDVLYNPADFVIVNFSGVEILVLRPNSNLYDQEL
jgi:hypothetical protein